MGRPVILGNGSLTVGLNESGLVHDFYYPYVGLDNLTTARSMEHKIGVWVDGEFSWIDSDDWQIQVDFQHDALVSKVIWTNERLQLTLTARDFIDHDVNAFCRRMNLQNDAQEARTVRVFMHQVFQISSEGRGDTALYVPDGPYLLDYKGRCALLVYGQTASGLPFDQYSVGNYGIEGKEGTYKDAEDGQLAGNAVEHGGVDSALRISLQLPSREAQEFDYWVIAADSQYSAEKLHLELLNDGLNKRLQATVTGWRDWLATATETLAAIPAEHQVLIRKSLLIIKAHCDKRGGIIASCDSSIYNYGRDYYSYVWPRDGAYAMWPLIRLGFSEEPRKFFEFCRDILHPDGYLMHKYQPDRAIGSTWHPLVHGRHTELAIQEDETAIVIYMLGEYLAASQDHDFVSNLYVTLIQPAGNFMAEFRDDATKLPHASYDLWEEKFSTSTYTTAITYQALLTAADFADLFEFPDDAVRWRSAAAEIASCAHVLFDTEREVFRKGFLLQDSGSLEFDNTLDTSSLYGPMMYALKDFGASNTKQTAIAVQTLLADKSPSGGVVRYEHDQYFAADPPYAGNPWFVTTLWLAQYYLRCERTEEALKLINWTIGHSLPSGVLSEQVNPTDGTPISVTPLVWSHAELINTLLDLSLQIGK